MYRHATPFAFSKTFIIYNVLVCLVMAAARVVFCILYASQEIHVVLLLKLRRAPASCIRVRIRVDVKMMLPH